MAESPQIAGSRSISVEAPRSDTDARFMNRTGVRMLGGALRAAAAVSPRLGGRLAYEVLSRPPRHKAPAREWATHQSARRTDVPVGHRRIKVYEWGSGPTVLMSHCWGGRATQMHALAETFVADGYRVVAFDGPAHGDSGGRRTDMFDFSQVVAAVGERVGTIDAVVAHSFGAAAALIGHRMYGLRARRYVLVSTFRSCEWFLEAFRQYFGLDQQVLSHMIAGFDQRRGKPVDWSELCMQRIVSDVQQPILLVHDRDDREIPFDHSEALLRAAPSATLFATSGLGHRRILRSPRAIGRIQSFLAER